MPVTTMQTSMTDEEMTAFGRKLTAFAATLTDTERNALMQVFTLALEAERGDMQGYADNLPRPDFSFMHLALDRFTTVPGTPPPPPAGKPTPG